MWAGAVAAPRYPAASPPRCRDPRLPRRDRVRVLGREVLVQSQHRATPRRPRWFETAQHAGSGDRHLAALGGRNGRLPSHRRRFLVGRRLRRHLRGAPLHPIDVINQRRLVFLAHLAQRSQEAADRGPALRLPRQFVPPLPPRPAHGIPTGSPRCLARPEKAALELDAAEHAHRRRNGLIHEPAVGKGAPVPGRVRQHPVKHAWDTQSAIDALQDLACATPQDLFGQRIIPVRLVQRVDRAASHHPLQPCAVRQRLDVRAERLQPCQGPRVGVLCWTWLCGLQRPHEHFQPPEAQDRGGIHRFPVHPMPEVAVDGHPIFQWAPVRRGEEPIGHGEERLWLPPWAHERLRHPAQARHIRRPPHGHPARAGRVHRRIPHRNCFPVRVARLSEDRHHAGCVGGRLAAGHMQGEERAIRFPLRGQRVGQDERSGCGRQQDAGGGAVHGPPGSTWSKKRAACPSSTNPKASICSS